jgi:hypothetical protein
VPELFREWEVGEGADNLGYDLARARENFSRNGAYYDSEDAKRWGARAITDEERSTKARIIKVLDELQRSEDRSRSAELWGEFESLETELNRYRNVEPEHGT